MNLDLFFDIVVGSLVHQAGPHKDYRPRWYGPANGGFEEVLATISKALTLCHQKKLDD